MKLVPKASLQRKQLFLVLLTTGVSLLLTCLTFAAYDLFTLRRETVTNLSTLVAMIGNNSKTALESGNKDSASQTLAALQARPSIKAGCLYDEHGKIFAFYNRDNTGEQVFPKAASSDQHYFSRHALHLSQKIMRAGSVVGSIYVESDLSAFRSQLQRYGFISVFVFVAASLLSLLLSIRLQRLISGPILHLMQMTRAVASDKNYSLRATKQTDDELGILVEDFNGMLAEIQSRDVELQKSRDALEERVRDRTQELANSVSVLSATLEATADGILVTDAQGETSNFNEHFIQMWQIPSEVAAAKNNKRMIEIALAQLKDPEKFHAKINELFGSPDLESFDVVELKDGRIFERYSKPQKVGENYVGRVWSFRNVTGRKRAESILQRTEELYRRAIAGADAVPYSYDYKTRSYLFIGEGISKLIGYSPEEVTGDLWKRIIQESVMSGETTGLDKDEAARRVQTGEILNWRCDMRVVTRDGKSRWISDTAVQNRNEQGQSTGSMGILQDITERKEAEQALREQDEKFHHLADNITDVFWIRSPDLKTLHYVSPAFEKIWGRPTESLYADPQQWVDAIWPEDKERVQTAFAKLTKEAPSLDIEYRITRPGGEVRWVHVRGFQVRDGSGKVVRLSGIVTDITERKQAEISTLAFSKLSQNLSSAAVPEDAARIISEVADSLLGWDACYVQMFSEKDNSIYSLFDADTINGERITQNLPDARKPTCLHERILKSGAELILRDDLTSFLPGGIPFGDTSRPSASLIFVPIRSGTKSVGILSIQSYRPNAYGEHDLNVLQTMADQCGGALERLWADEAHRKSELRLRQIEEMYRRAIAGADSVPYSYHYKTRSYIFIGDGIEQLIGYTPQEMNGELWKRIVQESVMAGETAGLDKEEASQRVASGQIRSWRCDMRVLTREGKTRWISDASVQNLDEFGQIVGSIGILQDITERKQTEITALAFSKLGQSLSSAASPQQAARIIGEISDELLGWDAFHVKIYSAEDDELCSVFNVDTIDGKKVEDLVPDLGKPTEMHRRIFKNGAELILRKDSESFLPDAIPFGDRSRPSASLMFVPIRCRGEAVGILSIQSYKPDAYDEQALRTLQTFADQCGGALERIRADEALRKSESQFRLVWNTSAEGMRLCDATGMVVMANDAYCRLVGKTKDEVEGQPLSVIHAQEKRAYLLAKHREEISAKTFKANLEKEVTLWNGKKLWFELSNSILEIPGQPPLLLSVFRDATQRKKAASELAEVNRKLLDASRQAGMAEVATSVLHNVGNVLNSVNVSGSLIRERVKKSRVSNVNKVAALFQEQDGGLPEFFANDPRGKQLPGYLTQLAVHLNKEQEEVLQEISSLVSNIEHIKEIVAMQQSYAKVSGMCETLQVVDLVEDALRMNAVALERHKVQVIREYCDAPQILVEKHKVLQILINLIRNAKYACDETNSIDKHIKIRITNDQSHLSISVIDNGIGIPPENLTRIFNHGFTTRKEGHGFGLHSGALAANEIGGSLNVRSEGTGKGAEFTLTLPVNT